VPSHGSSANLVGTCKIKSVSRSRWFADVGIGERFPSLLSGRRHLQVISGRLQQQRRRSTRRFEVKQKQLTARTLPLHHNFTVRVWPNQVKDGLSQIDANSVNLQGRLLSPLITPLRLRRRTIP
jgi:hypothetical protein